MGKRGKQTWSKAALPVGSLRIRKENGGKNVIRMIKVRMGGPMSGRWVNYARWLWEKHNGPVPQGKRVAHLDGDGLNDSLENLGLLTAADVVYLWHERNPEGSKANYEKCRAATAEHNRQRGRLKRLLGFNRTQWYAVMPADGVIINEPVRKRWMLCRVCGIPLEADPNGVRARRLLRDAGIVAVRGTDLQAGQYAGFRKVDSVAAILAAG